MFNLRADLKIYTSDKYLSAQKILKAATLESGRYSFLVQAQVRQRKRDYGNGYENIIRFVPQGLNESQFREFLQLANIQLNSIESIGTFADWAAANPDKTWNDFLTGVTAKLSLPAEKLDAAFAKIRPDQLMNDLCLSPSSKIGVLIGKGNQGYRRRRYWKEYRQNQLVRFWALFGNEVAISASTAQLETVVCGIQLHDFGISHCENMQALIEHVSVNVKAHESPDALAVAIMQLDEMIAKFGGKPIERSRPRSPYFRQVYDLVYQNKAA